MPDNRYCAQHVGQAVSPNGHKSGKSARAEWASAADDLAPRVREVLKAALDAEAGTKTEWVSIRCKSCAAAGKYPVNVSTGIDHKVRIEAAKTLADLGVGRVKPHEDAKPSLRDLPADADFSRMGAEEQDAAVALWFAREASQELRDRFVNEFLVERGVLDADDSIDAFAGRQ